MEPIHAEVFDLAGTVNNLRDQGVHFRNKIVIGVGGEENMAEDPSGNPIELFEPIRPEARLSATWRQAVTGSCLAAPQSEAARAPGDEPGWRGWSREVWVPVPLWRRVALRGGQPR